MKRKLEKGTEKIKREPSVFEFGGEVTCQVGERAINYAGHNRKEQHTQCHAAKLCTFTMRASDFFFAEKGCAF